jgi:hypothetical protein
MKTRDRVIAILSVGLVIPVPEKAIETGSHDELVRTLSDMLHEEVTHRLEHVMY